MTTCKFCGSESVVKDGMKKGIQRYLCKGCSHTFNENGSGFTRMRTPTHVIVTALNLYYDGLSVRKVAKQLEEIMGEEISQVAVWTWIQKYSKIVTTYIKTLHPNLSGKYHHDETEIKVGGEGRYFWEMIDEDTRFLVAHLLGNTRTSEDAKKVFAQALEVQRPTALFTDGSFAYDDAFNKVFYTRYKNARVQWVRRVGIRARETNNMIERKHGTLKDRLRPARGLKQDDTATAWLDGYVAYYNFCRVHQSIKMTPAQAAGLDVKGWKQLIERAQACETRKAQEKTSAIEVTIPA